MNKELDLLNMDLEEVAWRIGNLEIPIFTEENCDICRYQRAKAIAIDLLLKTLNKEKKA